MSDMLPARVWASLSAARPEDIEVTVAQDADAVRPYCITVLVANVPSYLYLSQEAAEHVVDSLVELLTGGVGHAGDAPPF
jgi:hypothetical protein